VWTISPGGGGDNPDLYRIEVNEGPGSGVKVLNKPIPPAFRESIGFAEQIDIQFYSDAKDALIKAMAE
jgi:ATP-dependent Lon protease